MFHSGCVARYHHNVLILFSTVALGKSHPWGEPRTAPTERIGPTGLPGA
jgi:hypothetical protein